ncbi:uncharacterized protein G2W53_010602 [Senna tora]|uniref:F-box domain-containing protein n=1 Tax=Senna tora TaxID=362788 RepID=A0A834X079_9FABA|nr:uncharacterized protein G2W53_010602 [Senna tora]
MDDLFSNSARIPPEIMCKIMDSITPEDIHKLPYVSKNWYLTCKRSYFFRDHSTNSREKHYRQMLFCVPEPRDIAHIFFIQINQYVNDYLTRKTFSKIPSVFGNDVINYVGTDYGVICFHSRGVMRCGFVFDNNNIQFCILLMWNTSNHPVNSLVSIFCSQSRSEWEFINVDNDLGTATWFYVFAFHKTYVIWCSSRLDDDVIVWHKFRRIDQSPASLRFLDFSGEYLICITDKMQYYDDGEHAFAEGMMLFENHKYCVIKMMTSPYSRPFGVKKLFFFFPTFRII